MAIAFLGSPTAGSTWIVIGHGCQAPVIVSRPVIPGGFGMGGNFIAPRMQAETTRAEAKRVGTPARMIGQTIDVVSQVAVPGSAE